MKQSLNELEALGNKFAIIAIDESQFWKDEIIKKAKKIHCVYLVNLTQPTHLAELSVSFPAVEIRNVISNIEAFTEDELSEYENDGLNEETRYFNGYFNKFTLMKAIQDESDEEEVRENEMANHTFLSI